MNNNDNVFGGGDKNNKDKHQGVSGQGTAKGGLRFFICLFSCFVSSLCNCNCGVTQWGGHINNSTAFDNHKILTIFFSSPTGWKASKGKGGGWVADFGPEHTHDNYAGR